MVRARVLERLEPLGFQMYAEANDTRSNDPRVISRYGSPVTVMVVPTNGQLAMARETKAVISKLTSTRLSLSVGESRLRSAARIEVSSD